MKRMIFYYLKAWIQDPHRKPLILRGARQVGKTHSIRELGKLFEDFVEINFEELTEAGAIFEKDLNVDRIIRDLNILTGKKIIPGKTLLFLDEAQEVPRSLIALRYFYEKMPDLHVIAAGSLLDFAIEQVGVPVGRVQFLYQHPMSFIEFLLAKGEKILANEILNISFDNPFDEVIHNKALTLLGEYIAIGGMPQAVKSWVTSNDISTCATVHEIITSAYIQDFQKYAKKFQLKYIELIFNRIPHVIGKTIKYTYFSNEYRKRELEPCLDSLIKANVTHKVIQTSGNGIPLGAESNLEKFKLIFLDIALAQHMLGLDIKKWFLDPTIEFINKGNLIESFIGQEMLAYHDPYRLPRLYYWQQESRVSQAEIDYVIAIDNKVIPIEVKSGEGRSLKSLRTFLNSHSSSYGIRFSVHNYSIFDSIHSYPLYAAVSVCCQDKVALMNLLDN